MLVNIYVAWESFAELGVAMTKQEVENNSPSVNMESELKVPKSFIFNYSITLYSADRRNLTSLSSGPFPWMSQ